jgi:hypothetical protein
MVVQLQMVILLLLFSKFDAISGQAINSSCQKASCGNVSDIPFPFGIGAGCYLDPWFEVVCNYSDSWASPKSVLKKLDLEVLNISLGGTVRVNYPTFVTCVDDGYDDRSWIRSKLNTELVRSPFIFSQSENRFIAIGCNNFASMVYVFDNGSFISGTTLRGGCISICDRRSEVVNGSSCNGINCCQTTIPSDLDSFNTSMRPINGIVYKGCKSAFLVEEKWFQKRGSINNSSIMSHVPVVLEWRIPNASFDSLPISYIHGSTSTANNSSPSYVCNSNITQYSSSYSGGVRTGLIHVLAEMALKEIPIFFMDVKVNFLYHVLYLSLYLFIYFVFFSFLCVLINYK